MTITVITELPPAPLVTDSEAQFASKASAFVNALATFRNELNSAGEDINDAIAGNLVTFDGFAGIWEAGTYNEGQVVFHTPTSSFYIAFNTTTDEPPSADWRAIGQAVFYTTIGGSDGTTDWVGSEPSVATMTVAGILGSDTPIVDIDLSNVSFSDVADTQSDWALVYRVEASADDEVKFYATDEPTEDLDVQIKVVR